MDIALADGMFIRMAGPSSGRTLLFVHAFADCGLAFTPLFDTPLTESFRLVAVDLPGFGASPRRDDVLSIAQHAEAIATLARLLPSSGPIGLVGHSAGSIIAVEAASRLGERFGGLFSIEGNLTAEDAYFSGRAADFNNPSAFKQRFLDDLWTIAQAQPILRRFYGTVTMADAAAMWSLGCDARRLSILPAMSPRSSARMRIGCASLRSICSPKMVACVSMALAPPLCSKRHSSVSDQILMQAEWS